MPSLERASAGLEALAAPGADAIAAEGRGDPLGLLVGVPLDRAAVRGDGDHRLLAKAVVEALDEFGGRLGCFVGQL